MAEKRLNVDELFALHPWKPVQTDLSRYGQLRYRRSDARREFSLAESRVVLEGPGRQFVVFPPQLDTCCVLRLKGLFGKRLETLALGPHQTDVNTYVQRAHEQGVFDRPIAL